MRVPSTVVAAAAAALFTSATPAVAGEVSKSVPFELGVWTSLEAVEGPVTLHRIRVVEKTGTITKSNIFRPGGSVYQTDVQIQLEYSNTSTHDWKADHTIEWLDADGKAIDGDTGTGGLDSKEDHDVETMTISTLKYGIEKAKTLRIRIDLGP